MSEKFDKCQSFVLKWEGGLSDDAADAGGLTKYGVSMAYLEDMARREPVVLAAVLGTRTVTRALVKSLTKEQAAELFWYSFWHPCGCDDYALPVALCVYDMAVNHGRGNAGRIVQRACNDALGAGTLVVDGAIGPLTKAALKRMSTENGIRAIAERRRAFYRAIVASRPNQKVFLRGWLNRAGDMEKQALAWL